MKISLSMIVKNEENNLTTALNSVLGIDEIVICDTGSKDNTVNIAKGFTENVFTDYLWNDDFAEARNYSLSKCTGDWILILDADEILDTSIDYLRECIRRAEEKGLKTISCKVISMKGGQTHRQPRIFKRCDEVYWKGAIHNHLSVDEKNEEEIVFRYGYSDAHKLDPDRALRILLKEVTKNPSSSREKYYLAREYWYRSNFIAALYWYDEYIKISRHAAEKADAYLMAARCLWNLHRGEQARDYCLQAIKINANFKEAIMFLASILGEDNRKAWEKFAQLSDNSKVLFVRNY